MNRLSDIDQTAGIRLDAAALYAALVQAPTAAPAVICVSRRLAQHLLEEHARACHAAGHGAWETPAILTLDAFLQQAAETVRLDLQQRAAGLPAVLTAQEQCLLWRLAVAETRSEQPLLREAEAAQLAADAWALVHEYELPFPLPATTPDVERFNHWAAQYRSRCRALGRVDAQGWRTAVLAAIAAGHIPLPAQVVLAGFHETTPSLRRVIDALRAVGTQLAWLEPVAHRAAIHAASTADAEQELRAAAAWARARAQAAPQARIGVVIPDLTARRAAVQRLFDEQLCPVADAPEAHDLPRPYNLTLGEPLAATGLVQAALRLLRLLHEPLPYAEAGALLCSGYWGGDDERLERAALDARLRRDGHLEIGLDTLRAQARSAALQSRCEALAALRQPQRRASAGEWVDQLAAVLAAAGWPGARPLDSTEFQVHRAWSECLVELGRLETVLGRVPYSAALAQLRELAEQTLFQPQSVAAGIQVMGALEAEGLDFDHLWVAGLDDEHWPPPGRPHPFLPYALQRERGLPHASAAQELAYAQRMTARWTAAAPEVQLSWPRQEQDRPLAPSPLLAPWAPDADSLQPGALPPAWLAQQAGAALETLLDAQAPPLLQGETPSGGARLLGDQALCPFRGYATHRLGARALEIPAPGLSYADRGNLVHRVLEDLWRQLRDQRGLLALDDAALAERIGSAVDAALTRLVREAPQRLRPALRGLEETRLRRLIGAWLAQEKARLPFRVIELEGSSPEQLQGADGIVEFEGLRLRLRRDRVDELEGGGRLVIDYKTGARRKLPWADARPEEPQLLIYALTGGPVVAIAYGRVVAGAVGFEGVAATAGLAPGIAGYDAVKTTKEASGWDALLGRWRGELHTVAAEVREGWAAVDPKHPRQTCRDCDLHALCRIRETVAEVAEDEGEA